MSLDELLAFAESSAPMLEWVKSKDVLQRSVIRAEVGKWTIDLEWFDESKYYPEGAICISAQEKNGGFSGAVKLNEAKDRLMWTIGKVDITLLEDVQTSLF